MINVLPLYLEPLHASEHHLPFACFQILFLNSMTRTTECSHNVDAVVLSILYCHQIFHLIIQVSDEYVSMGLYGTLLIIILP